MADLQKCIEEGIQDFFFTEAHLTDLDDMRQVEMIFEQADRTGCVWRAYPGACKLGKKYAGTLFVTKIEGHVTEQTYKVFTGIAINGNPVARSHAGYMDPVDSKEYMGTPEPEGRILIIMGNESEKTELSTLHDFILVYSPNTQKNAQRTRRARQVAHMVRKFKAWHKRYHPHRILTTLGDLNAIEDAAQMYVQGDLRIESGETQGEEARVCVKNEAGEMGVASMQEEESEIARRSYFDDDATDLIRLFAKQHNEDHPTDEIKQRRGTAQMQISVARSERLQQEEPRTPIERQQNKCIIQAPIDHVFVNGQNRGDDPRRPYGFCVCAHEEYYEHMQDRMSDHVPIHLIWETTAHQRKEAEILLQEQGKHLEQNPSSQDNAPTRTYCTQQRKKFAIGLAGQQLIIEAAIRGASYTDRPGVQVSKEEQRTGRRITWEAREVVNRLRLTAKVFKQEEERPTSPESTELQLNTFSQIQDNLQYHRGWELYITRFQQHDWDNAPVARGTQGTEQQAQWCARMAGYSDTQHLFEESILLAIEIHKRYPHPEYEQKLINSIMQTWDVAEDTTMVSRIGAFLTKLEEERGESRQALRAGDNQEFNPREMHMTLSQETITIQTARRVLEYRQQNECLAPEVGLMAKIEALSGMMGQERLDIQVATNTMYKKMGFKEDPDAHSKQSSVKKICSTIRNSTRLMEQIQIGPHTKKHAMGESEEHAKLEDTWARTPRHPGTGVQNTEVNDVEFRTERMAPEKTWGILSMQEVRIAQSLKWMINWAEGMQHEEKQIRITMGYILRTAATLRRLQRRIEAAYVSGQNPHHELRRRRPGVIPIHQTHECAGQRIQQMGRKAQAVLEQITGSQTAPQDRFRNLYSKLMVTHAVSEVMDSAEVYQKMWDQVGTAEKCGNTMVGWRDHRRERAYQLLADVRAPSRFKGSKEDSRFLRGYHMEGFRMNEWACSTHKNKAWEDTGKCMINMTHTKTSSHRISLNDKWCYIERRVRQRQSENDERVGDKDNRTTYGVTMIIYNAEGVITTCDRLPHSMKIMELTQQNMTEAVTQQLRPYGYDKKEHAEYYKHKGEEMPSRIEVEQVDTVSWKCIQGKHFILAKITTADPKGISLWEHVCQNNKWTWAEELALQAHAPRTRQGWIVDAGGHEGEVMRNINQLQKGIKDHELRECVQLGWTVSENLETPHVYLETQKLWTNTDAYLRGLLSMACIKIESVTQVTKARSVKQQAADVKVKEETQAGDEQHTKLKVIREWQRNRDWQANKNRRQNAATKEALMATWEWTMYVKVTLTLARQRAVQESKDIARRKEILESEEIRLGKIADNSVTGGWEPKENELIIDPKYISNKTAQWKMNREVMDRKCKQQRAAAHRSNSIVLGGETISSTEGTLGLTVAKSGTAPDTNNEQPFFAWVHLGQVHNVHQRIRTLALFDSGCSATVMDKSLAKRLEAILDKRDIDKDRESLSARCAFGETKQSEGVYEVGMTAPNGRYERDDTAEAYLDKSLSIHAFDGLSTPLIVGTNNWRDFVTEVKQAPITDVTGPVHDSLVIKAENTKNLIEIPINTTTEWDEEKWALAITTEAKDIIPGRNLVKVQIQVSNVIRKIPKSVIITPLANGDAKGYRRPFVTHPTLSPVTLEEDGSLTAMAQVTWLKGGDTNTPQIMPGVPVGKVEIHSYENRQHKEDGTHDLVWRNPALSVSINDTLQVHASSIAISLRMDCTHNVHKQSERILKRQHASASRRGEPWKAKGEQLDKEDQITLQRINVSKMMVKQLQDPTLLQAKDPHIIGRTLTWIAQLVEEMPHLTRAILHHKGWMTILERLTEKQAAKNWEAAIQARERLFQLLRADAAGLRTGETSTQITIDDTGIVDHTKQNSAWRHLLGDTKEVNKRITQTKQQGSKPQDSLLKYNKKAWRHMATGGQVNVEIVEQAETEHHGKEGQQATETRKNIDISHLRMSFAQEDEGRSIHINQIMTGVDRETYRNEWTGEDAEDWKVMINLLTREKMAQVTQEQVERKQKLEEAHQEPKMEVDDSTDGYRVSYGGPEDKVPIEKKPSELWWHPNTREEDPDFWDLIQVQLTERQRKYITNIEWPEQGDMVPINCREKVTQESEGDEAWAKVNRHYANQLHEVQEEKAPETKDAARLQREELARKEDLAVVRTAVRILGAENMEVFDCNPWISPTIKNLIYDETFLTLVTKQSLYEDPRPLPPDALDEALSMVTEMCRTGLCTEQPSAFNHNVMVVPKPSARGDKKKRWRLVNDLRLLNSYCLRTNWRLLPTFTSLEQAANHERFMCSDAQQGYYQVRLDPAIAHKLSFSVYDRRLCPTKALMGNVNSGSAFCLALNRAVGHMAQGCCELCKRNKYIRANPEMLQETLKRYEKDPKKAQSEAPLNKKERKVEPTCTSHAEREALDKEDRDIRHQREMMEWVRRSKENKRPTLEELQSITCEWHECDGVELDDLAHTCKGLTYVDDIIVAYKASQGGAMDKDGLSEMQKRLEFIKCIDKVLKQSGAHGIMMKAQKTSIMVKTLQYLGWHISADGTKPSTSKIDAFRTLKRPRNKKELLSALGALQYYRRAIDACSIRETCLYDLTKQGREWEWTTEHNEAFEELKDIMSSDNVLTPFDSDNHKDLILIVDSSSLGVGAVLCQTQANGEERPCANASLSWKGGASWSATQKEFRGVLFAVRYFKELVHNRHLRIVVDHKPLCDIFKKKELNRALHAMVLEMQDVDCTIEYRSASKVIVSDCLSRFTEFRELHQPEEGTAVTTGQTNDTTTDDEVEKTSRDRINSKTAGYNYTQRVRGPNEEEEQNDKPLVQTKRRLVRGLLQKAQKILKARQAQSNRDLEIVEEALSKGQTSTGDGGFAVADVKERAEETALTLLGGLRQLMRVVLGADKEQKLEDEFGKGYTQRLFIQPTKTADGRPGGDVRIFDIEDYGNLEESWRKMTPEADQSTLTHSERGTFIMEVETKPNVPSSVATNPDVLEALADPKITKEDKQVIKEMIEVLKQEHEDNTAGTNITQITDEYIPPIMSDYFCGAGGGLKGFKQAGFDVGTTCEIQDAQRRALWKWHKIRALHDWHQVKAKHLRGTFASFSGSPCTAFAKPGKQRGWADPRADYFPKQLQSAVDAGTPCLIIENVEEVLRRMVRKDGQSESPYDALRIKLEAAGYTVRQRVLDAGKEGGYTRRDRVIVQAISAELKQHLEQTQGSTDEERTQFLQQQDLQDTHQIDKDGFIWPAQNQQSKAIAPIMDPWDEVAVSYKLPASRWGEFTIKNENISGARKWGLRPSDDGAIGKYQDPHRCHTCLGAACGCTAMGNTGWYVEHRAGDEANPEMGVRRLQAHECARIAGITEPGQEADPEFMEAEMYEMANNAICVCLSRAVAHGVKAYYSTAWMKDHVLRQELKNPQWGEEMQDTDQKSPDSDYESEEESVEDAFKYGPMEYAYEKIVPEDSQEELHKVFTEANKESKRRIKMASARAEAQAVKQANQVVKRYLNAKTPFKMGLVTGGDETEKNEVHAQTKRVGIKDIDAETQVKYVVDIIPHAGEKYTRKVIDNNPRQTKADIRTTYGDDTDAAWKQLRIAQQEEESYRVLTRFVKEGHVPECPIQRQYLKTKDEFVVKDDILFRLEKGLRAANGVCSPTAEEYSLQLCVPRSMQMDICKRYHTQLGHVGGATLLKILRSRMWWPYISRDVFAVCEDCSACQRYKDVKPKAGSIGKVQLTEEAGVPMETIWCDFIGPYGTKDNATSKGNRCILLIMDDFSRWMQCFPLNTQTSEEVEECIAKWGFRYGWPLHVKSDRGTNIISAAMQRIYAATGVHKSESASVHPEGHARVERLVKHVRDSLSTTIQGDKDWDMSVEQVAAAWNFAPHRISGLSPFQILYGRNPRFNFDPHMPGLEEKHTAAEWVERRMRRLHETWGQIHRATLKYKLETLQQARERWKEKKTEEFKPGDMVRVYLPVVSTRGGLASKLQARYSTGYKVKEKIGPYTYKVVKEFNDNAVSVAIHISRLKRFNCQSSMEGVTPLTKIIPEDNYGEDMFSMQESATDALLGLGEEGEQHRDRAVDQIIKSQLLSKRQDAEQILRRWSTEVEGKIKENEEFILTPNEKSDTRTKRRNIPVLREHNSELGDEKGQLIQSNKESTFMGETLPGEGERECNYEIGCSYDIVKELTKEELEQQKISARQQKKTQKQMTFTKVKEKTRNGRQVSKEMTLGKLAKHWGVSLKTLQNSNREYWSHTRFDKDTIINKGTIFVVPAKTAGEERYPESRLGTVSKEFIIKEIIGECIKHAKDKDTGEMKPTVHFKIRWDPKTSKEGDPETEWISSEKVSRGDKAVKKWRESKERKQASVRAIQSEGGQVKQVLISTENSKHEDEAQEAPRFKYEWKSVEDTDKGQKHRAGRIYHDQGQGRQESVVIWPEAHQRTEQEVQEIQYMQGTTCNVLNSAGNAEVRRMEINQVRIDAQIESRATEEEEETRDVQLTEEEEGRFRMRREEHNLTELINYVLAKDEETREETVNQHFKDTVNKEPEKETVARKQEKQRALNRKVQEEEADTFTRAFGRIITERGRRAADDDTVTEAIMTLKQRAVAAEIKVLDVREVIETLSKQQQIDLMTGISNSNIWGLLIGEAQKVPKRIYERLKTGTLGKVTHIGTNKCTDKTAKASANNKLREQELKTAMTRTRWQQSSNTQRTLEARQNKAIQGTKLWNNGGPAGTNLNAPRPTKEEVVEFMKGLEADKITPSTIRTWQKIRAYLCKVHRLRECQQTDKWQTQMATNTAIQIVRYHLVEDRKAEQRNMPEHTIEGAIAKVHETIHSEQERTEHQVLTETAEATGEDQNDQQTQEQKAVQEEDGSQVLRQPQQAETDEIKTVRIVICKHDQEGISILTTEDGSIVEGDVRRLQKKSSRKIVQRHLQKTAQEIVAEFTGQPWEHLSAHLAPESSKGYKEIPGIRYVIITVISKEMANQLSKQNKWTSIDNMEATLLPSITREVRQQHDKQDAPLTEQVTPKDRIYICRTGQTRKGVAARKQIKAQQVIGDLTQGSTHLLEREYIKRWNKIDSRFVFNAYKNDTSMYYTRSKYSGLIWEINHNAETPNCEILSDGTVRTLQHIWPTERLEANYADLLVGNKSTTVTGGTEEEDKSTSFSSLGTWQPDTGSDEEEDNYFKLWQSVWEICKAKKEMIQIAGTELRSDSEELINTLQKLTDSGTETTERIARVQRLSEEQNTVEEILTAVWDVFSNRDITKRRLIHGEEAYTDEQEMRMLKGMEINNQEAALQWRTLYTQRYVREKQPIFEDKDIYYRFHLALSHEEERIERAKQPEHLLKNVEFNWEKPEEDTARTELQAHVRASHLGRGKADPTPDSEVKIQVKQQDGQMVTMTGMVEHISKPNANGTVTLTVHLKQVSSDTKKISSGTVTPVWRSPTAMRQRRSLQRIWTEDIQASQRARRILMAETQQKQPRIEGIEQAEEAWTAAEKDDTERGNTISPSLTETQQKAVEHMKDHELTLVQGPPGSGKTELIKSIVPKVAYANREGNKKKKILIAEPSNKTIEALVYALKDVRLPDKNRSRLRVCWVVSKSHEKNIKTEVKPYTLVNIAVDPPEGYVRLQNKTAQLKLSDLHKRQERESVSEQAMQQYRTLLKAAMKNALDSADVLIMTTSQAGLKTIRDTSMTATFVDEACQVSELNLNVVLDVPSERYVLIGDQEQLAARQTATMAINLKIQPGFMRLQEALGSIMLEHIFRNYSNSIQFIKKHVYKDRLKHMEKREAELLAKIEEIDIFKDPKKPKAYIEMDLGMEEHAEGSHSWGNSLEVDLCVKVATQLVCKKGIAAKRIVVITMYLGQDALLRERFLENDAIKDIQISTIDSAQGSEWDVVIISTTRTKEQANGFCAESQRINVMVTRHKLGIIIIGHQNMRTARGHWPGLLEDFDEGGLKHEMNDSINKAQSITAGQDIGCDINCINTPCQFCFESKAAQLFHQEEMKHVQVKWNEEQGFDITAKHDMARGHIIGNMKATEKEWSSTLNMQKGPIHADNCRRSTAWAMTKATEEDANVVTNGQKIWTVKDIQKDEQLTVTFVTQKKPTAQQVQFNLDEQLKEQEERRSEGLDKQVIVWDRREQAEQQRRSREARDLTLQMYKDEQERRKQQDEQERRQRHQQHVKHIEQCNEITVSTTRKMNGYKQKWEALLLQTDWDALYIMDHEYMENDKITIDKRTWGREQILGIYNEDIQWEDRRMDAKVTILTAMLIIKERQCEIRAHTIEKDNAFRSPRDTQRKSCTGKVWWTTKASQDYLEEHRFVKDITKYCTPVDTWLEDSEKRTARFHMVIGSMMESCILDYNPGLWEEMGLDRVIKRQHMHKIMQAYAIGQTNLRPCNENESIIAQQNKKIGDNRQRIVTQGRGIQYTATKNEASDAGERERSSNREVMKRENQELKTFTDNLYRDMIWKRAQQRLCMEMQIREELEQEAHTDIIERWKQTNKDMAVDEGNEWHENSESRNEFKRRMEQGMDECYIKQIIKTVQRKRGDPRKQALKQRALLGPRYLPSVETSDRWRYVSEELGYRGLHEQGVWTRHCNTGEVVHFTVPNKEGLQHATNVYGFVMKEDSETTGNAVLPKRRDEGTNVNNMLEGDLFAMEIVAEDEEMSYEGPQEKNTKMDSLTIDKHGTISRLGFSIGHRQEGPLNLQARDRWIASIHPTDDANHVTQNVTIIYKKSEEREDRTQLTYTEQWKRHGTMVEDVFSSTCEETTWYACLQVSPITLTDEGETNSKLREEEQHVGKSMCRQASGDNEKIATNMAHNWETTGVYLLRYLHKHGGLYTYRQQIQANSELTGPEVMQKWMDIIGRGHQVQSGCCTKLIEDEGEDEGTALTVNAITVQEEDGTALTVDAITAQEEEEIALTGEEEESDSITVNVIIPQETSRDMEDRAQNDIKEISKEEDEEWEKDVSNTTTHDTEEALEQIKDINSTSIETAQEIITLDSQATSTGTEEESAQENIEVNIIATQDVEETEIKAQDMEEEAVLQEAEGAVEDMAQGKDGSVELKQETEQKETTEISGEQKTKSWCEIAKNEDGEGEKKETSKGAVEKEEEKQTEARVRPTGQEQERNTLGGVGTQEARASLGKDIKEEKQVERDWSLQDVRSKVKDIEDREYNDIKMDDFLDILTRYYTRKIISQESFTSRQRLIKRGWWRQDFDIPEDESDHAYRERMKIQASQDKEKVLDRLQDREQKEKTRLKKEHKVQLKQRLHRWCKIMKAATDVITTAVYDAMSDNKREVQEELEEGSTKLMDRIESRIERQLEMS